MTFDSKSGVGVQAQRCPWRWCVYVYTYIDLALSAWEQYSRQFLARNLIHASATHPAVHFHSLYVLDTRRGAMSSTALLCAHSVPKNIHGALQRSICVLSTSISHPDFLEYLRSIIWILHEMTVINCICHHRWLVNCEILKSWVLSFFRVWLKNT